MYSIQVETKANRSAQWEPRQDMPTQAYGSVGVMFVGNIAKSVAESAGATAVRIVDSSGKVMYYEDLTQQGKYQTAFKI